MLSRPTGQAQVWTQMHELMASNVEVASVGASEKNRYKKPISITRPKPSKLGKDKRFAVERAKGAVLIGDAMHAFMAAGKVRRPNGQPATAGSSP